MNLSQDNFVLYAFKHYDNPQCYSVTEFENDLNRFKVIKKLLTRYHEHNQLNERLVLNHIIILFNVFGSAATNMLLFKLIDYKSEIITFLVYLNHVCYDDYVNVKLNQEIIDRLRKI